MIKHNQHRQALSELDLSAHFPAFSSQMTDSRWLASYPYATSGPLHTYAGLLCFYLSQPEHTRPLTERQGTEESSDYQETKHGFQVDKTLLRESRNWFQKALEIDKNDQVALDFIHLVGIRSIGNAPCVVTSANPRLMYRSMIRLTAMGNTLPMGIRTGRVTRAMRVTEIRSSAVLDRTFRTIRLSTS